MLLMLMAEVEHTLAKNVGKRFPNNLSPRIILHYAARNAYFLPGNNKNKSNVEEKYETVVKLS